jgi:glycerophosphoryl diester phosphodiesterase
MRYLPALLILLMASSAFKQVYIPKFDLQGHRGCRGIKPENTIPAFITALDSGVTTLEMDLAVTADQQLVVSHEPWMSAAISTDPSGNGILAKEETKYNIYKMTYAEVSQWDVGSKGNERFPEQEKMKVSKPLLKDVVLAVEKHIKDFTKYEVDYNIEIKSMPAWDDKFHPKVPVFSDRVYTLLNQYIPMDRVVIQSFDFRVLKYWHEKYPDVRLAALVENKKSMDENLAALGFKPSVYSPEYNGVTREVVRHAHELKMRIIPWTVNDTTDMRAMKSMGTDGLITDYPNRARKLKLALNAAKK